jgi:phage baseplate assembly protein W
MKFLGAPYPILPNALGLLHTTNGVDQIKSDMLVLLLTNPGERVMLPAFGTPLKKLIFEQNDTVVAAQARQMIINSINLWEPRVAIQQIQVSSVIDPKELNSADDKTEVGHILSIRILFIDPDNIKEVQQLSLEVPLSGG